MKNIDTMLPVLNAIISGMAEHFGSDYEFVIHDYSKGVESSVISIENGHVTNRQIGDGATALGLRLLQGKSIKGEKTEGVFNYLSQTKDGRILKSSTIYLKDDDGNILGSLCINNDITQLRQAKIALEKMIFLDHEEHISDFNEMIFVGKVDDMLLSLINESIESVGCPVAAMTREQKIEGIKYLEEKGTFKIQKSAELVAKYYDISKFTVYNYLNELKKNDCHQH